MRFKSLLPHNRTPAELQIEQTLAAKYCVETLDPDVIRKLHEPTECPAALLPWLAYSLSVDVWDDAWDEAKKRRVIAASVDIHRHKGTVGAVKRTLAALGVKNSKIIEWFQRPEQIERGHFFVEIPPDDPGIDTPTKQAQVLQAIDGVKRLSAHYVMTLFSELRATLSSFCDGMISGNSLIDLSENETINSVIDSVIDSQISLLSYDDLTLFAKNNFTYSTDILLSTGGYTKTTFSPLAVEFLSKLKKAIQNEIINLFFYQGFSLGSFFSFYDLKNYDDLQQTEIRLDLSTEIRDLTQVNDENNEIDVQGHFFGKGLGLMLGDFDFKSNSENIYIEIATKPKIKDEFIELKTGFYSAIDNFAQIKIESTPRNEIHFTTPEISIDLILGDFNFKANSESIVVEIATKPKIKNEFFESKTELVSTIEDFAKIDIEQSPQDELNFFEPTIGLGLMMGSFNYSIQTTNEFFINRFTELPKPANEISLINAISTFINAAEIKSDSQIELQIKNQKTMDYILQDTPLENNAIYLEKIINFSSVEMLLNFNGN